jgi:hypothetical protein
VAFSELQKAKKVSEVVGMHFFEIDPTDTEFLNDTIVVVKKTKKQKSNVESVTSTAEAPSVGGAANNNGTPGPVVAAIAQLQSASMQLDSSLPLRNALNALFVSCHRSGLVFLIFNF